MNGLGQAAGEGFRQVHYAGRHRWQRYYCGLVTYPSVLIVESCIVIAPRPLTSKVTYATTGLVAAPVSDSAYPPRSMNETRTLMVLPSSAATRM